MKAFGSNRRITTPSNIVRTGENAYRISLAVAGFKPEQINVTVNQNTLIVTGKVDGQQQEGAPA